jgi:hypothetical protein
MTARRLKMEIRIQNDSFGPGGVYVDLAVQAYENVLQQHCLSLSEIQVVDEGSFGKVLTFPGSFDPNDLYLEALEEYGKLEKEA